MHEGQQALWLIRGLPVGDVRYRNWTQQRQALASEQRLQLFRYASEPGKGQVRINGVSVNEALLHVPRSQGRDRAMDLVQRHEAANRADLLSARHGGGRKKF